MVKASFIKHAGVALVALCAGISAAQAEPVGKYNGELGHPYEARGDNNNDNMFVAGGTVGGHGQTSAYAGVVTALPGSSLGNGWVQRIFAQEVTYDYKAANGTKIDAEGYGASLTYGYQHTYNGGWWGLYAGPAYSHVHLSPNDPRNKSGGNNVTALLSAEGDQNVTNDFKFNEYLSYSAFDNNGYYGRLRALYRVSGNMFFGPEGAYQGDNDYKAWQAGLALVGIPITDDVGFGVDGGVGKTDSQDLSAYGGLELNVGF